MQNLIGGIDMAFKENSIFTKTGRLKRKIDKTEKFLEFLYDLRKRIDLFADSCDKTLEELIVSEETIDDVPECEVDVEKDTNVINDPEFDVINKLDNAINEAKNKIITDCDKEDIPHKCEECESNKDDVIKFVPKKEETTSNPKENKNNTTTTTVQKIVRTKKTSEIKGPAIQNKKVTINKAPQKKTFLNGCYAKTAIKIIAENNVDLETTIKLLAEEGIELEHDPSGSYINYDGTVVLSAKLTSDDIIDIASFKFKLAYVPHGPQTPFFNQILDELGLEKIDPEWKTIGLGGTACMVQIDDEVIAVNLEISKNQLHVTFIYNVDK